jgi:hypothetical protein
VLTEADALAARLSNAAMNVLEPVAGRCRLTVSKPVLKAKRLRFQRLKLECDELLSNLAFNFNLRRYTVAGSVPGTGFHSSTSHLNLCRFVHLVVFCPVCDQS